MEAFLIAIYTLLLPFLRFPEILRLRTLCKDTKFSWVLIPKKLTIEVTDVTQLLNLARLAGRLAGRLDSEINLQINLYNSELIRNPKFLNFLKQINLRTLSFNETSVDDSLFRNLFNCISTLKTLVLDGKCYDITDSTLVLISQYCPYLIHLKLFCCTNLTFRGIRFAASLLSLDLSGCDIDDTSLYFIGQISTLRNLSFESCDYITDEGIHHLRECKRLEHLNISNCDLLTGECFRNIFHLKNLKIFLAFHIKHVTNRSIAWLKQAQSRRQPRRQPPEQQSAQPLYVGLVLPPNAIRYIMERIPVLRVGGVNNYIDTFPPNISEAVKQWR